MQIGLTLVDINIVLGKIMSRVRIGDIIQKATMIVNGASRNAQMMTVAQDMNAEDPLSIALGGDVENVPRMLNVLRTTQHIDLVLQI